MDNNNNNAFLIAGSIVAAGALIAIGIYFAPTSAPAQNETADGSTANDSLNVASIDNAPVTDEDYIRGSSTAAVTILDYSDLECPFCKRFHNVMKRLQDKYSGEELAWVYRHFPLEQLHSKAPTEAHAAECAAELGGQQAFWDYTDRVFEVTPSNNGLDLDRLPEIAEEIGLERQAFVQCQESDRHQNKVQADLDDARAAGGSGTPFVIIQLSEEPDTQTEEFMKQVVQDANQQSRGARLTINENATKISSNGALPFRALDRLVQLATDSTTENSTTTAAVSQ